VTGGKEQVSNSPFRVWSWNPFKNLTFAACRVTVTQGQTPERIDMRLADITKIQYETVSWLAFFTIGEGEGQITAAVGIERLREIVQSADKEWSLLTAKEGGNS